MAHQIYVNYLRSPGVKFMSIDGYNKKFNTKLKSNDKLETALKKARREMGPNDFLVQNFIRTPRVERLGKKSTPSGDSCPKPDPPAEPDPPTRQGSGLQSLDDLLTEEVQDEYSACKTCGSEEHDSFESKLDTVEAEDAQTLNHMVAFKGNCANIKDQTMKGKSRYIDSLKAYAAGDATAEVRMFSGKKMLVSALKPNKESLKKLFESFPNGPHIVDCD